MMHLLLITILETLNVYKSLNLFETSPSTVLLSQGFLSLPFCLLPYETKLFLQNAGPYSHTPRLQYN